MISDAMRPLVENSSVIREMFEEGARLKKIYGEDSVYDFSLGNPNVPAPAAVNNAIRDIIENEDPLKVHGYMSNAGFPQVRAAIAQSLNSRFGVNFSEKNIIMTVGAGLALNVAMKVLVNCGEEIITFAPYFVEYGNYAANYGARLAIVPADTKTFLPDLETFESMINKNTRAVIINSPHNPTGVIYPEETIKSIAKILEKKQKELSREIFLISDEPYRELVYDGTNVPYVTKYYDNTLVCYSFSKTLSLPGERIGYLAIPDSVADADSVISAAAIAVRISGAVNAPSLMQLAVARCLEEKADIEFYRKNRDRLYGALTEYGFECTMPAGAFYLWMKTPEDEAAFVAKAKEENILVVPGTSFACAGYVRLAYCVSYGTIEASLPGFKRLAEHYGLRA